VPDSGVKAGLRGLPADLRVAFAPAVAEAEALDILSAEERARLITFAHPDRRRAFALGRLAARSLLAGALRSSAPSVPLGVGAGGAPEVTGHDLYISIAHAGRGAGVAAVAAIAGRPVGVDLELNTPRHPDLLPRLLTPQEASLPASLEVDAAEQASLVWTLKESVLKGLGTGLRRGARSVVLEARDWGLAEAFDGEHAWQVRYERREAFWVAVAWKHGDE
jgi:4'-phosphopantetheinyl transferase